ncbi:PKD domain-containing protein [bacterium]|nr:PKD domain-containing protein [bacterium]RQV94737.1 MAG: PKD domain-containing protein [bacterium]
MNNKHLSKFWTFVFCVIVVMLITSTGYTQIENCDFYGTAQIHGVGVTSSNTITAYNQYDQLLSSDLYYIGGGNYAIHVYGDPNVLENTPITFKIDNETANVVGGSNIWNQKQSKECNLNVPSAPNYPVADAGGPYSGNEGSTIVLNGSGSQYADTYSWNFGDGTPNGSGVTPSHKYMDNGTYSVSLTVTNAIGSDTDYSTANIYNVAPTVEAGNNQTTNEGTTVSLAPATFTDPALGHDNYSATINWGDGNITNGSVTPPSAGNGTVSGSHAYGDNGVFTVTVTVNDGDGGIGNDQFTVTSNNVPPTANAGGPYYGVTDHPVQLNGSGTDPGFNDVLTYAWDLDNSGTYETSGQNPTVTFSSPGTYTVGLRVSDDDGGIDTDQATIEINVGVQIIIDTFPSGKYITVDGQQYTAPKTFYWIPGNSHYLSAPATQWYGGEGSVLDFDFWNDGGAREHGIVVPSTPRSYTAYYQVKHWLEIDNGGRGGNPIGEGYYTPGAQVVIWIDSIAYSPEGNIRSTFQSWTGSGNGSYSGSQRQVIVTVNEPLTQTVNWSSEYLLDIQDDYNTGIGEGWYLPGAFVEISVDGSVEIGNQARHQFLSWEGEGEGSYTGTDNPVVVYMNGPIVETAIWQTQYYLDLDSTYGGSTGEGWYSEGAIATVELDTLVEVEEGERLKFDRWEGSGSGAYTGENWTFQVEMNGPITETAQWERQYYLTVISDWGNPTGEGWYDENALVSISVDAVDSVTDEIQYLFSHWTGTGSVHYSGTELEPSILLEGPVEQTAHWNLQYFVYLEIDPPEGGEIFPITAPGGWVNAIDTLKLTAVGEVDSGYGFSHWSGDIEGEENPLQTILEGPVHLTAHFKKGRVIVNSEPSGLLLVIDGEEVVTPVVFSWLEGEHHSLGVVTPQGDNISMKYEFREWSDGGAQQHEIEVADSLVVYTAVFDEYYYIQVESDYGNTEGEGWYQKGDEAVISVLDSLIEENGRVRRRFAGWQGTGNGSVTSTKTMITVHPQGPITERALWTPQFKLLVTTYPPILIGASVELTPPGPWYDTGDTVFLEAVITDPSNTFIEWSGDITGTANPISVIIDEPIDIVAHFITPNMPPQIVAFPDTSIMEDQSLIMSFQWLSQYITDESDEFEELEWSFDGGVYFTFNIDEPRQRASLIPALNWSGMQQIICYVVDPIGMTDADTFVVHVLESPDPPGAFRLVSPPQDTVLQYMNFPLEFTWKQSANVDLGDAIMYSFYFSPSPDLSGVGTLKTAFLSDTTAMLVPQLDGSYYWGVRAKDSQGYQTWCDEVFQISIQTGVESESEQMPTRYHLSQNYPNPFNPETMIEYQLPRRDRVVLRIFDIRGSVVRILVDEEVNAGCYRVLWDGQDEQGVFVSSGVYFVEIRTDHYVQHRKMILIR